MSIPRGPLFIVHVAFGTLVVLALYFQLRTREHEVDQLRQMTARECAETKRLQQEILEQENLRDGLVKRDPYVVELLVRDRLQYTRPGEVTPPPVIDKSGRPVSK